MPNDFGIDGQWERVASELRAYRDAQQQAWGNVDDATLGRYLAGEVTPEERQRIEAALERLPELRKLTDLVSDVLRDCEPIASSVPAVLPFPTSTFALKTKTPRWRRWAAVAAAACLLLALTRTVLPTADHAYLPTFPHGDLADARRTGPVVTATMAFHPPLGQNGSAAAGNSPSFVDTDMKAGSDKNAVAAAAPMLEPVAQAVANGWNNAALALADGWNNAGETYQKQGDLDRAELSYKAAYNIREWKLGPTAPPTVATRRNLGEVYQQALNLSDAAAKRGPDAPPPGHAPAPDGVEKKAEALVLNSAAQVRDRITRQAVGEVRKSVVPILVQNLREAQTPKAREQLGRALAELGPAAQDAAPVLQECLKSGSPEVRRAAEYALLQLGPAARDEVMRLADGEAADHPEWKRLKERMQGVEGRVGIRDACELFSLRAVNEVQREIRDLALNDGVEVLAETRRGSAKDDEAKVKDRAQEAHVNGVYLVIHPLPLSVEVYIGDALRGRGFDEKQQERLRQVIEAEANREDYDKALAAGVRYIADFQAEKVRKGKPAKSDQ